MTSWDHNAYYHRLLLRHVPEGATRALDVRCGAGHLTGKLALRVGQIDALDREASMIEQARPRVPPHVRLLPADFLAYPLEPAAYDVIVSMSTLHHMPLSPALHRMAAALRPGGTLAVVALPRVDLPRELPVEAVGTAVHLLVGLGLTGASRRRSGTLRHGPDHDLMPTQDPVLTTRQVRAEARTVLPGVRIRRLALWRYLLVWHKPGESRP